MLLLKIPGQLRHVPHKPVWLFLCLLVLVLFFLDRTALAASIETESSAATSAAAAPESVAATSSTSTAAQQQTTTPEPDASPGCKAPDIRFSVIKSAENDNGEEQPAYAKFLTTPGYLPDDYSPADHDYELNERRRSGNRMSGRANPYQLQVDDSSDDADDDDDIDDDANDRHRHYQHHHGANHGDVHDDHDNSNDDDQNDDTSDDEAADDSDEPDTMHRRYQQQTEQRGKYHQQNDKRRSGTGRRRRLENDNGQTRGRGSRYRRHAIHADPDASADTDRWSGGKLSAEGEVYYMRIDDILKSHSPNQQLRLKLFKIKEQQAQKKKMKKEKDSSSVSSAKCKQDSCGRKGKKLRAIVINHDADDDGGSEHEIQQKHQLKEFANINTRRRRRYLSDLPPAAVTGRSPAFGIANNETANKDKVVHWQDINHEHNHQHYSNDNNDDDDDDNKMFIKRSDDDDDDAAVAVNHNNRSLADKQQREQPPLVKTKEFEFDDYTKLYSNSTATTTNTDTFERIKRKSGKTTGALSRPKGGGDSSSKTTSRKDKGIFDEDGGYSPVHPDEVESEEEEEEEEEIDIQQQFTEVSEIRFPGEIGPLGDRRLCKIRCIKGKWVGPLCATNEEDDNGNVKFQPLYKSCHVQRIPPYLLLSYRNISVNVGWDLPHGHSLQARCKDLGLYKLLGESRVLCSNGLWAPRMPSCVPTTLLTNFSDDSAPSIRFRILNGSGSFEPSGVMAVLPHSTILLDCMYPRTRGIPEWTWTSWYMQYPTGWAHEDKSFRYRLSIRDIENGDSGTFTCTSPRGLTNSIAIVVATSICPQLPEPAYPLTLRLEGNKLGQRAIYRCPPGYRVDGNANATCLASGNWSSSAPACHAVQCPRLSLNDPHLSLIELNTSAWGRAIFKCQWGFKLTGPPTLECEPTGIWSGPVPRCKAIQCPIPVAPLNGRIGGINSNQRRLTVGALITFSCNDGHTLVGEPSIICTENGFWSHSPPFCKSQCPYPGDPPNGLLAPLKFSYDSGDYISVQCRPGYVQYTENGPPERPKCQPDGNWSGPVPECRSYEDV